MRIRIHRIVLVESLVETRCSTVVSIRIKQAKAGEILSIIVSLHLFPKLIPIESCFNPVMPERRNLCCYQNSSSVEVRSMILRDLPLDSFNHAEFRRRKELLHRFLKQVDVIHTIHHHHLRLVDIYVLEDIVHTAGVDVLLI